MDVKYGSGAFMPTYDKSVDLAKSIVNTAKRNDTPTHAVLTSMHEVLGLTAGNALEVKETVDYLTNTVRNEKLHEVVLALTSEMLTISGLARDKDEAVKKLEHSLDSGLAAEKFDQMVAELGGPKDFINQHDKHLDKAEIIRPIYADQSGFVSEIDVRAVGNAVIILGGGRKVPGEVLDMAVGFSDIKSHGEQVDQHQPIAFIHANDAAEADRAEADIKAAFKISADKPEELAVVDQVITAD